MTLFQIILFITAALGKYGPALETVLAGCITAYRTGGAAAVAVYILSLINLPTPPAPKAVLEALHARIGAKTKAAVIASCTPSDGCSCCLECARCAAEQALVSAADTLAAILCAQCCDDAPAVKA